MSLPRRRIITMRIRETFCDFPDRYIHKFRVVSDTGIEIEHLQNYIYIPLDIFLKKAQNEPVKVKEELDEWLLLLSSDRPEVVEYLAEKSSRYREVYREAYNICRNMEEVMGIFSEELKIMDRNMVQYMIKSRDEKIRDLEGTINSQSETISSLQEVNNSQSETISSLQEANNSQNETISSLQEEITKLKEELGKARSRQDQPR